MRISDWSSDVCSSDLGHRRHRTKLTIVVRAPNISAFDLSGRNSLAIEGYKQPHLRLDVSGSADVTAAGETDELNLDLSGGGDVEEIGRASGRGRVCKYV